MSANNVAEVLELVKTSRAQAVDELTKNFTQPATATTGVQPYSLEVPSKTMYPVLTPLRNRIPRVGGGVAIQANWKAFTGINLGMIDGGVSEGQRGGLVTQSHADYFAAFRGIGMDNSVTDEALMAAKNFEDLMSRMIEQTLRATMIQEEVVLLGGNGSGGIALGITPTPTLVGSTTGGTLAAQAWSVICVALTVKGYWRVAGANNGNVGQSLNVTTAQIAGQLTRNNRDGSTDVFGGGSAQKSAAASATTTGATSSIAATVAAVRGAVAYAWFWGAAGAERLGAVTTINSVSITAATGGANQLASALTAVDSSQNVLDFDGLLTIASKPGIGGYFQTLATGAAGVGTTLTGAGGRVVEIDAALATFYDQYRLQPNEITMNFRQFQKITNLVLGATNPNVQFIVDPAATQNVVAGRNVGKYLSPITGELIDLVVHPNMPPGTILFRTTEAPAYVQGVGDVCRVLTRREYYGEEWPRSTRRRDYGVYADEVLQHYLPFTMGVITNVA